MTKTKVLTAPYDPKTGALLHHATDGRRFSHLEDPETGERLEHGDVWEQVGPTEPGTPFPAMQRQIRPQRLVYTQPDWRPNDVFHACLQIDSMRSGRSAKYVIWTPIQPREDDHRSYPMFITDLLDVMKNIGIERGGIVCARWIVAKRGQNYGIKVAE